MTYGSYLCAFEFGNSELLIHECLDSASCMQSSRLESFKPGLLCFCRMFFYTMEPRYMDPSQRHLAKDHQERVTIQRQTNSCENVVATRISQSILKYVICECGQGHFSFATTSYVISILNLRFKSAADMQGNQIFE